MRRVLRRAAVSCVLMSADATEAMLEPGLMVLWYDGQVDLAARGKASIQWRSGEASSEYAGRTTRGCGQEPGWASEAWEGNTGSRRVTGMLTSQISSKHAEGVTW